MDDRTYSVVVDTVLRDTGKALLVRVAAEETEVISAEDKKTEVWIPKSAIHDDSEVYELGGEGTLVVFLWFARARSWV